MRPAPTTETLDAKCPFCGIGMIFALVPNENGLKTLTLKSHATLSIWLKRLLQPEKPSSLQKNIIT